MNNHKLRQIIREEFEKADINFSAEQGNYIDDRYLDTEDAMVHAFQRVILEELLERLSECEALKLIEYDLNVKEEIDEDIARIHELIRKRDEIKVTDVRHR